MLLVFVSIPQVHIMTYGQSHLDNTFLQLQFTPKLCSTHRQQQSSAHASPITAIIGSAGAKRRACLTACRSNTPLLHLTSIKQK